MRIAHVTPTYPPYLAGTGNVCDQNARLLAELGHDVTVYTARAPATPATPGLERNGHAVRRLRPLLRLGNAPLLPSLARLPPYDLVHLHYPFIFGAETVLLSRRLRRQPYVLTYHNDLRSPGLKGALFRGYVSVWGRRVLTGALRVIVPALDAASASPLLGPLLEAQPERFAELPNGVDATHFHPRVDGSRVRRELGLGDRPMLLVVGTMDGAHHPKIGVPVLLEALAHLPDGIALVLAGGGDWVEGYRAEARRLGLAARTHFVGRIEHSALPQYYAAADVVVQPSLIEFFGLVAIEAMACGRPVITSDVPGTRRVVGDAGGGLLVPAGDAQALAAAIERLLDDPQLRLRLGKAGRAAVEERFDWPAIGRRLEALYRRVLEEQALTVAA